MITNLIKKNKKILLYIIFGVLTSVINILFYICFKKIFNWNYFWSNNISWIFAILFAFFSNKSLVFGSKYSNTSIVQIVRELITFSLGRFVTLIMEDGILWLLISSMSINEILSKIISTVIVIITNYFFSLVTFKSGSQR